MSVTIRLTRIGKRNQPAYRIVVANTKDKRNGRSLDTLGYYNPSETPVAYELDKEKFEEWVKKGALVTDAVQKLVDGTYEYKPYRKAAEKGKETEETDESDTNLENEGENN